MIRSSNFHNLDLCPESFHNSARSICSGCVSDYDNVMIKNGLENVKNITSHGQKPRKKNKTDIWRKAREDAQPLNYIADHLLMQCLKACSKSGEIRFRKNNRDYSGE